MPVECSNNHWSSTDLESVAYCRACGCPSVDAKIYTGLRDYLEDVPGEWTVRCCPRCASLYLDPRPKASTIGRAYRSYYTHNSGLAVYQDDNGGSTLWRLANGYLNVQYGVHREPFNKAGRWIIPWIALLRQQLDYFYRHLPPIRGHLLDVGCGNGVFLLRAKAAGWMVTGLEPDPLAAQAARDSGAVVIEGTLDTFHPETVFEVITASHVIEHVHEPLIFVRRIYDLLRPDGTIWLATPNAGSLGRRWYGRSWRGLEPPRHITIFSARALRTLLHEAGFESVRFHRRGRGASYILNTSRDIARQEGRNISLLPPFIIDFASSCVATASEELVVTAKRPAR